MEMTQNEITHEKAVEIDTRLAELSARRAKALTLIQNLKLSLASHVGIRPHYATKTRREVNESLDTLIEMAEAKVADPITMDWKVNEIKRTLDRVAAEREEYRVARRLAEPLEALYNEHQWSRFFLVPGGHIHSSMNCHSCNIHTQFGWLPTLSGLTEKDAVDAHGTILCSHCYPSAPVEWTLGIQKDESDICQGTRDYDKPSRTGYYTGNWATCSDCGKHITITSTGKLRKHKKEAK